MDIGDLVSLGGSMMGDYYAQEREQDALNKLRRGQEESFDIGNEYYKGLTDQYKPEAATYLSDLGAWRQQAQKAPVEMGQFDTNQYDVNKYLNPSMDYEMQQAMNQVNQGAAAGGSLLSGATLKALQDRSQNIARQNYQQAFQNMQGERQFGYQDYLNHFKAAQDNEMQRLSNLQGLVGQSGAARSAMNQAAGSQANLGMQNKLNLANIGAQKDISRGNYLQGQFDSGAKGLGELVQSGANYLFPSKPAAGGTLGGS